MNDVPKRLGQFMRLTRYAQKAVDPARTVPVLAKGAGISEAYWMQIERGDGPAAPNDDLLRGIASALQVPFAQVWMLCNEDRIPEEIEVSLRNKEATETG